MSQSYDDLSNLRPGNLERIAKALKIDKVAKERGRANLPDSSASGLDEFEVQIIGYVAENRSEIHADTAKRMQALNNDIAAQKGKVLTKLHISEAQNQLTELDHGLDSGRRSLEDANEVFRLAKLKLETFKDKRRIIDAPAPEKHFIDKFAILIVFVVIEALANMVFFSEGNELGLIGGYAIAVGISFFNVFGFYAIGYFLLKRLNSVLWHSKILGILALALILFGLPVFHGLIAFYRQSVYENPLLTSTEATATAWSHLLAFDFQTLDLTSIGLFVLGVGLGAIAAYKGYTEGHEYPGYERHYKKLKAFQEVLQNTEDWFRDKYIDSVYEISTELRGHLSQQGAVRAALQNLNMKKVDIYRRLDQIDLELAQTANALISRYRTVNTKSRSEPTPKHFQTVAVEKNYFGDGGKARDYDAIQRDGLFGAEQSSIEAAAEDLIAKTEKLGADLKSLLVIRTK